MTDSDTDDLTDYQITSLASFNTVTGEGHELAGLYFYQQLDILVELVRAVARDFFKRPQIYVDLDGDTSRVLATLHARYGSDETLPNTAQRDEIFQPIFGSTGQRRTIEAYANVQSTHLDFPCLRDALLDAAAAFAERVVENGIDMLRQRVRDAQQLFVDYLRGLEGSSIKWSRNNALPHLSEDVTYTILRSEGVSGIFGIKASANSWPYAPDSNADKLIVAICQQLTSSDGNSLAHSQQISNLQRLAARGAEALATIIDFNQTSSTTDLDHLITKCYLWRAALSNVRM